MSHKRSPADSVDKDSDKVEKQHATLSTVGEASDKNKSSRGKSKKPKLGSDRDDSGASTPSPLSTERKKQIQRTPAVQLIPGVHNSGASISSPPSMEGKRRIQEQPADPGTTGDLQAALAEVGVKLPIPEILVIGGRSYEKWSLLEELFHGFRFNAGDDKMRTRRPLFLQMRHVSTAVEPKYRFQEENSEKYEGVADSDIAGSIKQRTESHLKEINAAVSAKPIVISAEFARWPNFTIIDAPDLDNSSEEEDTSHKILEIVESLATPPNRLVLLCQNIRHPICPNMLQTLKMLVPTSKRIMTVLFMFDDELQHLSKEKEEVCNLFRTTSKKTIHPFFVAIPKHHRPNRDGMLCNDNFLKEINKLYIGGFNEDKSRIGLSCLMDHLKSEIDMYMKIVVPVTLALLQERFIEASEKLARLETKKKAMSDISQLRASAIRYAVSFCTHLEAVLDGAEGPAPEDRGKTTFDDLSAIERVMNEFNLDTESSSNPHLAANQVGITVLALCPSAESIKLDKAAAEVARSRAQLELAPLIRNACKQLKAVLKELFDVTRERMHKKDSEYQTVEHTDVFAGFLVALRWSYDNFVAKLSKKCKRTLQHRLNSAINSCSYISKEIEASKDMSSPSDGHGDDVHCNQEDAIIKIEPNADIQDMWRHIWRESDNYLTPIRDRIKEVAPTELKNVFLNQCRCELLQVFGSEHFFKGDDAFKGMIGTDTVLNTINKERESLLKHQELLRSCQQRMSDIYSQWLTQAQVNELSN